MSDNNDIASEQVPPASTASLPTETPRDFREKCHKGFIAVGLISLLALILAIYAAYNGSQSADKSVESEVQAIRQNVSQMNQQLIEQQDWQTTQQGVQAKQQQTVEELEKSLQTALHQRFYQKQDWLLYKARYYLELAQINSHWSDNQQTTLALLQEADSILQTINDQKIFVVRQSLAQEMSQLKALPVIDVAGILSQLDSARQAVTNLPLQGVTDNQPVQNNTAQTTPAGSTSWRSQLHKTAGFLKSLVVVRHHETEIQPLLSPLHQAMVRESLRMALQQAQWAVLQHNDAVYQQTLNQALEDISHSFDTQASGTKALISQIQELQKIQLNQKNPMIDQSLQQLNELIDTKNTSVIPEEKSGGNQQ